MEKNQHKEDVDKSTMDLAEVLSPTDLTGKESTMMKNLEVAFQPIDRIGEDQKDSRRSINLEDEKGDEAKEDLDEKLQGTPEDEDLGKYYIQKLKMKHGKSKIEQKSSGSQRQDDMKIESWKPKICWML